MSSNGIDSAACMLHQPQWGNDFIILFFFTCYCFNVVYVSVVAIEALQCRLVYFLK